MADKYLNQTGVLGIRTWAEGKFALDSDLDTLSGRVDDIVSEGGEPNTIETVKVNGTPLVIDGNKAVDVPVPTRTGDLANNGDGTSNFATEDYVATNGGKIDKIKVNGNEQTIANKEVNISVPTSVSDLTNDSGYQTASDVASAINSAVASAYIYKGSVATVDLLPTSSNTIGDVYDVQSTGVNYAWTGTEWDALGSYVDISVLWTSVAGQTNTLEAMTIAEVNAILNAE